MSIEKSKKQQSEASIKNMICQYGLFFESPPEKLKFALFN